MKSGKYLTTEIARHYGFAPKRENESQADFENRVHRSLQETGIDMRKPKEAAQGAWALMAIFL